MPGHHNVIMLHKVYVSFVIYISKTKTWQQPKFKKCNYLKHNPKLAAKATDFQKDNENWVQPSYAQVTACAPLKRPSLRI